MGKSSILARLVAVCAVTAVAAGGVLAGAPVSAQAPDVASSSMAAPGGPVVTPAAVRGDVKATCLRITIAGVTAGGRASVKVTGTKANKRYSKVINRSKTLRVTPGIYRVTSRNVAATGGTDEPTVATKKLRVRKNRCTGFTVRYRFVASTPVVKTCASFAVGDTGPGGGMVFYVDMTRPTGSQCFEAAPSGWNGTSTPGDPQLLWGVNACDPSDISTSTAFGAGSANTAAITGACAAADAPSAWATKNYTSPTGKSDWFLPSQLELNQECRYASGQPFDAADTTCSGSGTPVGGFAAGNYWSSSQVSESNAWYQRFYVAGNQIIADKNNAFNVRPVRAF